MRTFTLIFLLLSFSQCGKNNNSGPYVTPPIVTITLVSVTSTSITYQGQITSDGNLTVTAKGVCWNTLPNPTIAGSHTVESGGTSTFTNTITGLSPSSTYYLRAYATNAQGTGYSNQLTITL
jgi:hypothetical protein